MTYEQLQTGVQWTLGYWRNRKRRQPEKRKCTRYTDFSYAGLRARSDRYWFHLEHMTEYDLGEEVVTCFLNTPQWNTRVCRPGTTKGVTVLRNLKQVVDRLPPYYAALAGHRLGDVDFGGAVTVDGKTAPMLGAIVNIYAEFLSIEPRFGKTATSKLMHMANPQLFMMWDKDIRDGYSIPGDVFGTSYIAFLVLMQESARHALATQPVHNPNRLLDALSQGIHRYCQCGVLPVTRLLDIASYPVGHAVAGAPDTRCDGCRLRANKRLEEMESDTRIASLMDELKIGRF